MRKAVVFLALFLCGLVALVLLVAETGSEQTSGSFAALATSCGVNDGSGTGSSPNTPYTGALPQPSAPTPPQAVPIPAAVQPIYDGTADRYRQVPAPILEALGSVESGQGANLGPSSAGAVGWMQFLPSTWDLADPNNPGHTYGDGGDPNDPAAAIPAAARLLIGSGANGTPDGLRAAIFAYNHSTAYVDTVLATANAYATGRVSTSAPAASAAPALQCLPQDASAPGAVSITGCVSPVTRWVESGRYGESRPGHIHAGVDMGAPYGTPIYNACAGTVTYAGDASGYGGYICVQHTPIVTTCHGHEQAIYVTVGQKIPAGFHIGDVGGVGQGDATGPHDHFEVRTGLWGPTSDPVAWLKAQSLPVPAGA